MGELTTRLAVAAVHALGRLPPAWGYAWADLLAAAAYALDRRRRRRARGNVARALPDRPPAAQRRIVAASYRNLVRLGYDLAAAGRHLTPATLPRVVVIRGGEHLERLRRDGGRAVYLTAHVGVWEVLGIVMGLLGLPLTSVAREEEGRGVDRVLRRLREVHGQRILPAAGVVAAGRRLARAGARLAFLADQHPRAARVWIPFLGRPAAWSKTPAGLARRLGLPLQVGFCRRRGRSFRFEVTLLPPIPPDPERPFREDVARMTAAYAAAVEAYVRAHPEDYLWQQRRWRTPVDGEEYYAGEGYVRHRTFGSPEAPAPAAGAAAQPRGEEAAR